MGQQQFCAEHGNYSQHGVIHQAKFRITALGRESKSDKFSVQNENTAGPLIRNT